MSKQPMPQTEIYDVAIIGGGINGVAAARDATLRGLKVYLCEQGDLGQATSSASSKIAHGGLRYLEQYDFAIVRKGLKEREVLLNIAPHLVQAIGFVLPVEPHLRPGWMIRLGLFIYDHLYRSKVVPHSRSIPFEGTAIGAPLKSTFNKGFLYHDGWMDDARLVILTAKDAHNHGATIAPHTACHGALFKKGRWHIKVKPAGKKTAQTIKAKTLMNATGPWAEQFLKDVNLTKGIKKLALVKGSHIVVPKLFDHNNAYLLQTKDKRVVFAFPYQQKFTMIGTTDTPFKGDPKNVQADAGEIKYLCHTANTYFKKQITPKNVVWHFSGVRPLIDHGEENASKVSRDYNLHVLKDPALINIWGGKFTSHRLLGQEVVNKLERFLGKLPPSTTATTPLPGGDLPRGGINAYLQNTLAQYPWLEGRVAQRLIYQYGTQVHALLGGKNSLQDLGKHFGGGLYQAEVDYLCQAEWAHTAQDILWRRTKLGLHLTAAQQQTLEQYLKKGAAHA